MRGPDHKPQVEDRYLEVMGREPPPPVPEEEPLAWQWAYRGTKDERERLRDELLVIDEDNRGPQPDQDTSLF